MNTKKAHAKSIIKSNGKKIDNVNLPLCFVIMPFGKNGSREEIHYKTVYDHIIKRAIEAAGFSCLRGDEIPDSGQIPEEVKKELNSSALVLADLSDRNPNVFYEVGYRHALNKPLITISNDVTNIPFNVSTYRTIHYTIDDVAEADVARDKITECAKRVLESLSRRDAAPAEMRTPVGMQILSLKDMVERGFANLFSALSDRQPFSNQHSIQGELTEVSESTKRIISSLCDLQEKSDRMVAASRLLQQTTDLGLVSIYPTRQAAMESEFFNIMEREEKGLDIVGSTLFGLKGNNDLIRERLFELIKIKKKNLQHDFRLRILLTHWEYISHRQDQEKTQKNITRFVISKELKEVVDLLEESGLSDSVRFYRAAPTCFTVICRGQGVMLVNPYPYQKEAYNSWTAIFRETRQHGVFKAFSEAHFDGPWENKELAIPFGPECVASVGKKLQQDLEQAKKDIAAEYASPRK